MTKIRFYLLLCIVVFATGCPKYRPQQVDFNNSHSFVRKLNEHFFAEQTRYRAALNDINDGPEKAKAIRNSFIEDVLPYIDEMYMDYIVDLQAGRDRANFVADVVELGTSAAVGITNGERPLQIIGIALTAFRGGRRSADLNFYKEQTTPILINKMDGNRAKVRATILNREKEPTATYPIGAAISDIVDYYNAGTLVRAFTELQKDTAAQTKQAEDNLLQLKGVPLSPLATPEEVQVTRDAQVTLGRLQDSLAKPEEKAAATEKLRAIVTELAKDQAASTVLVLAGVTPQSDGDTILSGLVKIRRDLRLANPPNITLLNKINGVISKLGE